MRKLFNGVLILIVLALAAVPLAAIRIWPDSVVTGDARVIFNGQFIHFEDQGPVIIDGRTLVPVRPVFEAMGFSVGWDEETQTVSLSDNDGIFNVSIQIGAPHFSVGVFGPDMPVGHAMIAELEVPAQIIGGRTMLPIRAVLEAVGYQLEWLEDMVTIRITPAVPSNEPLSMREVNFRPFLGGNIAMVRDLLGSQTYSGLEGKWYTYHFDTGLQIGVDGLENERIIMSIWVDYSEVDNRFHFNGINGESTYDDVVALLGDEPYNIRQRDDDPYAYDSVGAVFSYGYFLTDGRAGAETAHEFVRFFFDDEGRVVAISFFW